MGHATRWALAGAMAGLMLASGGLAASAQDKSAVIKERQDLMKAQGADLRPIQAFAKGEGEQAAALAAATDLMDRSSKIASLFIPGTSSADLPGKTNAKPDIWQNWDKFKAIPASLQGDEQKLLDAIKAGNRQGAGDALGAIGKNGCGACHGAFREKMS